MSHLGGRLSELVDGELEGAAADRALRHLAECQECRDGLEVERLLKQRLVSMSMPAPGDGLLRNLLELGGPAGPLPPRRDHVPGSPRPAFVSPGVTTRPPTRHDVWASPVAATNRSVGRGPHRPTRPRRRVAAAMVGAVCLVGAGVTGGVVSHALSPVDVVSPIDSFVIRHLASTDVSPFATDNVNWSGLRGH